MPPFPSHRGSPLHNAFRCGGAESRRWSTRLFYVSFIVVSLWTLLLLGSHSVIEAVMRRFHLSSSSYPGWYIQQVVPSMYSFGNEYARSHKDLPLDRVFIDPSPVSPLWVNHYPPRLYTFGSRARAGKTPFFIYCRSRFRGRELLTKIRVDGDDLGGFRMTYVEDKFQ